MPKRKHDYIFLDAGYTLFSANPSPSAFYYQVCTRHGIDITKEQMVEAMRGAWIEKVLPELSDPDADLSCSDEEDKQWWWSYDREVFRRIGIPAERQKAIFEEIYPFFSDPSAWELYPDTIESLEKFKSERFSLAIVSNWNSSLKKVVDGLNLGDYFEFLIASAEAGSKKPSPKIFHLALEQAGVEPSRAVHVGDTYQADVLGARRAGIRGIMLDRRGGEHKDHEVIRKLGELYPLLFDHG
jgi:putative hydrolase of the HAD superfamily